MTLKGQGEIISFYGHGIYLNRPAMITEISGILPSKRMNMVRVFLGKESVDVRIRMIYIQF